MSSPSTNYWDFPYTSQRMPVLAGDVVSTSQPLASAAGLQMLTRGGNAVDAALATAIAMTVVEPCQNGIGGDMFALIWDGKTLHGLNASGRAPAAWTPEMFASEPEMPFRGWNSVTVPGTVSGWRALWEKFGSLPFEDLFQPALRYAREGYLVSPTVQRQWAVQVPQLASQPGFLESFAPHGRAPAIGERFICPGQADTLASIAKSKGDSFYHGELAAAIAAHARATGGLITEADLAAHTCEWVEPIRQKYRDIELCEIGPGGQGIGALMALGILQNFDLPAMEVDSAESVHLQLEAMKLAFADLYEHVADPAGMRLTAEDLLDPAYLKRRAELIDPKRATIARPGQPHNGGTVYLTAADRNGMMVSFIQSNFKGFGSGVVVPGRGIALHNRGWGFSTKAGHANQVAPGKRPFHTIIPGFWMRDGQPLGSFGVMGGSMQAQGHVQMTSRLADYAQNPQAALDAPRWRVHDDNVRVEVEWNFSDATKRGLADRGHDVSVGPRFSTEFGSGQVAYKIPGGYLAAADHRKDSCALGI